MFEDGNFDLSVPTGKPLRFIIQASHENNTNHLAIKTNQFWTSSFKAFLASSNLNASSVRCFDGNLESLFLNFWDHKYYEKAVDLITPVTSHDRLLPTQTVLKNLLNLMMIGEELFSRYLYNSIYTLVLNLILNYPPVCVDLIKYYRGLFKEAEIKTLFEFVLLLFVRKIFIFKI